MDIKQFRLTSEDTLAFSFILNNNDLRELGNISKPTEIKPGEYWTECWYNLNVYGYNEDVVWDLIDGEHDLVSFIKSAVSKYNIKADLNYFRILCGPIRREFEVGELYDKYVAEWKETHDYRPGEEEPVCFAEWCDNELQEMNVEYKDYEFELGFGPWLGIYSDGNDYELSSDEFKFLLTLIEDKLNEAK